MVTLPVLFTTVSIKHGAHPSTSFFIFNSLRREEASRKADEGKDQKEQRIGSLAVSSNSRVGLRLPLGKYSSSPTALASSGQALGFPSPMAKSQLDSSISFCYPQRCETQFWLFLKHLSETSRPQLL